MPQQLVPELSPGSLGGILPEKKKKKLVPTYSSLSTGGPSLLTDGAPKSSSQQLSQPDADIGFPWFQVGAGFRPRYEGKPGIGDTCLCWAPDRKLLGFVRERRKNHPKWGGGVLPVKQTMSRPRERSFFRHVLNVALCALLLVRCALKGGSPRRVAFVVHPRYMLKQWC